MPRLPSILSLFAAAGVCACADHALAPDLTTVSADPAFSVQGPPEDLIAYRVTGDYVLTQHSWPIFRQLEIGNLDAWVTRGGVAGGSLDFYLEFSWGASLTSHEDVVCLSVNRATRELWVVSVRYGAGGTPHYSIAQAQDRAPEAMSPTGHLQSGRRDIATGRSMTPAEGADFCMQQPDLATIPHPDFGPVEMFPIEEGDIRLQVGGGRGT